MCEVCPSEAPTSICETIRLLIDKLIGGIYEARKQFKRYCSNAFFITLLSACRDVILLTTDLLLQYLEVVTVYGNN